MTVGSSIEPMVGLADTDEDGVMVFGEWCDSTDDVKKGL
jgi:hypothetical protein